MQIAGVAFLVEKAYDLLEAAHQRGRLAHAFLITGNEGAGKKELAARVINLVNPPAKTGGMDLFGEASEPEVKDLDELEGEFVRIVRPVGKMRIINVEQIRKLEKSLHVAVAPGKWKVGVVMHAECLNEASENAFLKTLEEPPPDSLLLLLSDAPERLLPTVLSRCVKLPLISSNSDRNIGDMEKTMLRGLSEAARSGMGNIPVAMQLKAKFSSLLEARRDELTKTAETEMKAESQKYKNTTDSSAWLKEREKYYLARTEATYVADRKRLLDILAAWLGDAMRQKCRVGQLEFPAEKERTAQVAESFSLPDLLRRVDAFQGLRRNLETNASESLVLEVGFLEVFGEKM